MQRIEYYDNYREFLNDYFQDRKKRFAYFSNRYFCQKAGIKSPSLFQEVVDGKRNLTDNTIKSFVKGLGLTDRDASFFTILVHLNQAKTDEERDIYIGQLKNLRQKITAEVVPADHYEYYSKWYNPTIRELCCLVDWHNDYDVLASLLQPPITSREAKESVSLLVRLGFLTIDEQGKYSQSSPAITTGKQMQVTGVRNLNKQLSELGIRSIEAIAPAERHISSMTVGISENSYKMIHQEIQEFKDRIRSIVDEDKVSDTVYNLNIHLFPLTKKSDSAP